MGDIRTDQVSPHPYRYPATRLRRKHGPAGYARHRYFLPWLRDEFDFRCAYCLLREVWGQLSGDFEVEHFLPRAQRADLALTYENLVYSCANCNRRKSTRLVPDPAVVAYGDCVEVDLDTGEIRAKSDDGIRLVDELALDQPKKTKQRLFYIDAMRAFAASRLDKHRLYMGLPKPSEMPDLANLERMPKSNSKAEGVQQSWFARHQRGEAFPEFYE